MKKYSIIIILLLFCCPTTAPAQLHDASLSATEENSDSASGENSSVETTLLYPKISLLTCSPGSELYSAWGHSALRIKYSDNGSDVVFNFGLFDFNTPNFYTKFVRGKLEYMLGVHSLRDFMAMYEWEERYVIEQKLNLTPEQKQDIISRLEYLYQPENRSYYYSFLYKNCTSELRDLIFAYAEVSQDYLDRTTGETFRDLLNRYTSGWAKFGINTILGSSLDREVNMFERMFLPDNLMEGFAEIVTPNGSLVLHEGLLLDIPESDGRNSWSIGRILSPSVICSSILLLVILSLFVKRVEPVVSRTIFAICGFAGIFIFIVTIITEHVELYYNYNMLWLNPLFLIPAFMPRDKGNKIYRISLFGLFLSLITLTTFWIAGVQYAEPGFIIIATAQLLLIGRAANISPLSRI